MLFVLVAALPPCPCLSQKCDVGMTGGAEVAIEVLSKLSPNDTDFESRQCIDAAISMAAQMRSKEAIPELIRYLSFRKEVQPEQESGDIGDHRHVADSEYPGVVALALIGPEARPKSLRCR